MFNKISYRTINIAKYSGVALLFALAAVIIVYFLSGQMTEISENIHTYNNIFAKKQERIALSVQLNEEINKIGPENEAKLQTALIIDENISDIIQIIDNLAKKYSSRHSTPNVGGITRISPGNGTGGLAISSIDYSLQMTANVDSLLKYLKELEANRNFISTTTFTISSDDSAGWNNNSATVNISGKIYYKSTN